ncbi:MAG: hypothetical protein WCS37_06950, partial [Chloroflexota bacterium]
PESLLSGLEIPPTSWPESLLSGLEIPPTSWPERFDRPTYNYNLSMQLAFDPAAKAKSATPINIPCGFIQKSIRS